MVKATDKALADTRNEANQYSLTDSELASVSDFDSAMKTLDNFNGVESYDDYGTGFEIIDSKDRLVDNPFVILEWRFTKSAKYGTDFVSATVVTKTGEKLIINDGSTGVCKQLRAVTDMRVNSGRPAPQTGLLVSKGLRRSDYTYTDDAGIEIQASTYYLA